jgi:hypothetical protein
MNKETTIAMTEMTIGIRSFDCIIWEPCPISVYLLID